MQDEVNQEESEPDRVDEMKEEADSTVTWCIFDAYKKKTVGDL